MVDGQHTKRGSKEEETRTINKEEEKYTGTSKEGRITHENSKRKIGTDISCMTGGIRKKSRR